MHTHKKCIKLHTRIFNIQNLKCLSFTQYFHDKAVAKEIDNLHVSCPHDKCNWTGVYCHFQVGIVIYVSIQA